MRYTRNGVSYSNKRPSDCVIWVPSLVNRYNILVDRYVEISREESGYSSQIEAVLGSIQEAVLIFDAQRIIQFANEPRSGSLHGRILRARVWNRCCVPVACSSF